MTDTRSDIRPSMDAFLSRLGLEEEYALWKAAIEGVAEQARVEILIVGEFNHGKSSLINMLVEKPVLRVAMTPTTQVETTIGFGAPEDCVWIYDPEGNKKTMPLDAYDEQNIGSARRVEIRLASSCFGPEVLFVDTPGLNEAHALRETLVQELMHRATLVLYLLDASQPATRQEICQIEASLSTLPPKKRLIVMNKCDRLDADELLDVCAYVEKTLWPKFRGETFYFVSAKKKDYAGNQALILKLEEIIEQAKAHLVEDASKRLTQNMWSRIRIWLWVALAFEQMARATLMRMGRHAPSVGKAADVEVRTARMDQKVDAVWKEFRETAELFENAFRQAVVREIEKVSIEDAEDYLEGFVASEFRTWMIARKADIADGMAGILTACVAEMAGLDKDGMLEMSCALAKTIRMASVEAFLLECQTRETVPLADKAELVSLDKLVRLSKGTKARQEAVQKRAEMRIGQWADKMRHAFSHDLHVVRNDMMHILVQDDRAIRRQIHDLADAQIRLRQKGQSLDLDLPVMDADLADKENHA